MRAFVFATALTLVTGTAMADVPTMILPDLTFPPKEPVTSTQGCTPTAQVTCDTSE